MGWSKQLGPGIERGLNYVVNISSVAGLCPLHAPPYGTIKGGIHMMSHKMRVELVGTDVRVTEIFPDRMHTPFFKTNWQDRERARSFTEGQELLKINDIVAAAS